MSAASTDDMGPIPSTPRCIVSASGEFPACVTIALSWVLLAVRVCQPIEVERLAAIIVTSSNETKHDSDVKREAWSGHWRWFRVEAVWRQRFERLTFDK